MAKNSPLRWLGASALGLALSVAAAGCGSSEPVAGITNPNPGSVVDGDKAAVRDDLPVPRAGAPGEPVAESASSSPSGTGTSAGTGGPGGGQPGNDKGAAGDKSPVPASPPAKENAGNASGGTRPADRIEVGTPRSPQ